MTVEIRAATGDDAPLVALLGWLTFVETFGALYVDHPADLAAYLDATFGVAKIARSLGDRNNAYWVATVDALPVGYAKLKLASPLAELADRPTAQLQKIYVLNAFLGSGLGVRLLTATLDCAASSGAQSVWLSVLQENARAIAFYRAHGFAPVGTSTFTIGAQTFAFATLAIDLA